ncbi:hypothetical protein [Treponema sp.]|uniref:hypothetical protein n=1 Tax=Treponema sp. TaxID=166 RepID=UPI0025D4C5AF|nr:hypothetical protein [Treponema sp.]MCR5218267.1 hypothetical protein [Treponema sp.]
MPEKKQELVNRFLRTFTHYFTLKDMTRIFLSLGIKAKEQEVREFLDSNPYVFSLEREMYITKAGAFTGKLFSIHPTSREFDQKMVVIGHRCIPFVNNEIAPSAISFFSDGQMLKSVKGSFDSQTVLGFYSLFGEEYAPQYVAADPANAEFNLVVSDFELPPRIFATGFDITPLIEKHGFSRGDRLLCSVSDWDNCCVNVMVCHEDGNFVENKSSDARVKWYSNLEEHLINSFDRHGPCDSIESQLETVFFEHADQLCIYQCGSISEYIERHARKVGIEFFGVETRLWKKGETVPAVGPWNKGDFTDPQKYPARKHSFWATPDFIFDQYILDMFFRREKDCSLIIPRMYPSEKYLNQNYREELLLLLESRSAILSEEYNWFADRSAGELRQKALDLYTRVSELVFKIDSFVTGLEKFPQQELVILSQLYSHVTHLLQVISDNPDIEGEVGDFLLSVDGMNWNFEEVRGILEDAVDKNRHDRFKVIK